MQTKKGSLAESLTNIAVGFTLNWWLNVLTLPILWDSKHPKLSALYIGIVYTGASLVRSFSLRRVFNRLKWGNKESLIGDPPYAFIDEEGIFHRNKTRR